MMSTAGFRIRYVAECSACDWRSSPCVTEHEANAEAAAHVIVQHPADDQD